MKIGVLGKPFFARKLVKELRNWQIDTEFIESYPIRYDSIRKALNSDIIHFIFSPTVFLDGLVMVILLKLFGKRIIVTWIGDDTLFAAKRKGYIYSRIGARLIDVNIALTKWLAEDLDRLRIGDYAICPLPIYMDIREYDLPGEFAVSIYLPEARFFKFYGGEICERIIDYFEKVHFIILTKDRNVMKKRPNTEFLEYTDDMNGVYRKTTVLLRIPKHDGLSNMVLEALSVGRYVIYSYPLEGCIYAKTFDDIKYHLKRLLKNPRLEPNINGRDFFQKNYNKPLLTQRLIKIYNSVLSSKKDLLRLISDPKSQ